MKIVVKYLSEEFSALCLTEPVPIYNVVKQLSPWTILQHHVDFGVRLKNLRDNVNMRKAIFDIASHLEKLADVLVTEHFHCSYFKSGAKEI